MSIIPARGISDTFFNVKRYGAAGDGVKDDTVAIQSAINVASAAGGGTVYLPSGTYIAGMLQLKSSVLVVGAGKNLTIVRLPNNAATRSINGSIADANGNYGLSVFSTILSHDKPLTSSRSTDPNNAQYLVTYCGVLDMTIDGNWAGQTSFNLSTGNWAALTSCITFANVGFGRIERCRCINGAGYPIEIGYTNQGGSDFCKIIDNEVLSYNPAGVGIAMITGKFNEFRGNYVDSSGVAAFDCEPNILNEQAYGWRLVGNKLDGAVYVQGSGGNQKDVVIDDNVITITGSNNVPAIRLNHDTTSGARISNNRMYGNGQPNNMAVACLQGSQDVAAPRKVIHNTATGFTWLWATVDGTGAVAAAPQYRIRLDGNVYSGKNGIYISIPFDVQVTDNVLTLSGGGNLYSAVVVNIGNHSTYSMQGNIVLKDNILHGSGVTTQFQTQDDGSWTDTTWTPDFLALLDNIWDVAGNAANPIVLTRSFRARGNAFRQTPFPISITGTTRYVLAGNIYINGSTVVTD